MVARKKAKKASVKKKTSTKKSEPVQSAASKERAELEKLAEERKQFEAERAEFERQKEESKKEAALQRINSKLAAGEATVSGGGPPMGPTGGGEDTPLQSGETPEQEQARLRQEAREERVRKRKEERERQTQAAKVAEERKHQATITSLDDARAKKSQPVNPAAVEGKEPVQLPLPELHKYKLQVLSRQYQDELDRLKEPLKLKYAQMLQKELNEAAQQDEKCMGAQRAQVECMNELVALLTPSMPEGYAITQVVSDKDVIVCQYVPNRAGKPLNLPGVLPDEG